MSFEFRLVHKKGDDIGEQNRLKSLMESNMRYHLRACQKSLERIIKKRKMENENISTKIRKERNEKKQKET
jgi:hypothetical protein